MKVTVIAVALLFLFHAQSNAQNIKYTDATTLTLYGKPDTSGPHYHRVDTARYNDMLNGKWRFMMDMAPRRLPVFEVPEYPTWSASGSIWCGASRKPTPPGSCRRR